MVLKDLDTNKFIIMVDDTLLDMDHYEKIYRMTIAEEFAHILLHKEAIEKVSNLDDFKVLQNHGNWHKHERNAKWLAASILMPFENIMIDCRNYYKEMVCIAGFANPEAIKKFMVNKLAEKYEVSTSAMKYRLDNWPVGVWKKVDEAMKYNLEFLE